MIKINTIPNNESWKRYLKNPNLFIQNKIKNDKEIYLGDIIVNLSKIKNKKNKINFLSEFNKLWIHGLVHLFGYDHKKNSDFLIMNKIEKKFISYLN